MRMAAAEFIAAGETDEQVARRFRVTKMSVNRWRHALQTGGPGALVSRGAAGTKPLLTLDQQQELMALIEVGPAAHGYLDQRWTLARIAELIRVRFGVRFHSSGALHEMLTRIGASWQVPTRRAAERNEQAFATWREETWPSIKARP
ncbi:winged helix-turn-helix domain-containing protein [Catenulispora sp. GP43]|uniref:winged helix-turn-helix domain-containing protein n=1 Tax=Catenulispora sp. GP43 TaxID=3156263 RepID=UPI003516B848